ncbi:hypothetical protein, partial [Nonomuraea recticatena]|uniref:hypothetical protein n=1 Tax=Nonomuraea recticatena TaxID=46178 RepID=UPI0031F89299
MAVMVSAKPMSPTWLPEENGDRAVVRLHVPVEGDVHLIGETRTKQKPVRTTEKTPEMQKGPHPTGEALPYKDCAAATYSPTPSRV